MLKQREAYEIVEKYIKENPGVKVYEAIRKTEQLAGNYYAWKRKLAKGLPTTPLPKVKSPTVLFMYGDAKDIARFIKEHIQVR